MLLGFFHIYKPTLKFVLDIDRGAGILYWIARLKVIAIFSKIYLRANLLMRNHAGWPFFREKNAAGCRVAQVSACAKNFAECVFQAFQT